MIFFIFIVIYHSIVTYKVYLKQVYIYIAHTRVCHKYIFMTEDKKNLIGTSSFLKNLSVEERIELEANLKKIAYLAFDSFKKRSDT